MTYTTADYVYDKIGITETEIGSDTMDRILEEADAEVDRIIKTTCKPKNFIKIFSGDNRNLYFIRQLPLLSVSKLEIDNTSIDIPDITFNKSGKVRLTNSADKSFFYSSTTPNNCRIKYTYGWLEDTTTQTETTSSIGNGTSKALSVADAGDFSAGDWVRIDGFDGYTETAKIISIASNVITLNLVYSHESDSTVTKLQVPAIIKTLAGVIASIMGATYMMGKTYTFATSYSVPDYSVTRGVPYPHFNRNMEVWVKERDLLLKQIAPFPTFA